MSHAKRILSRVRIHGGDSGVSARATHHNVQGFVSEQAELRTVRNSTTERKKMSTKTTFKRIALGTVAALATSLLTVVAVPSASATAATATAELAAAGSNTALSAATNGNCLVYVAANDTAVINRLVRDSIKVDFTSAYVVETGTGSVAQKVIAELTGPGAFTTDDAAVAATTAALEKNAAGTIATFTGRTDSATTLTDLTIKTSGTGTIVVKTRYVDSAGVTTPIDTFTIEVNAACPTVGYSAAKSSVTLKTSDSADSSQVTTGDVTGANVRKYTEQAFITLFLADQYGTQISSTGAYLEASATNGAFVAFTGTPAAGTAVATSGIATETIIVSNGASGTTKPVSTVVTIKANGTVVGTKSITFTGVAASVTLSELPVIMRASQTKTVKYVVKDAAGNQIAETASAGTAANNVNGASFTSFTAATETVAGTAVLTAGSTQGASTTYLNVIADDGTTITSAAVKFPTSNGNLDTFTVALDKKTYAPGEVATLTITGKNAEGNLIGDGTALGGTVTVVPTGLTAVSDTPTASSTSEGGVWTFKYYASTTPAAYGISVKTSSAATTTTAVTATFNVVSAGSSEIAQLVKVIGNLLTTFTKQITALIKALKR